MLGIMIKVYTSFSSGRVLIAKLMAEWPSQALWEVVGSSAGFPNDPGWQEHVIIFASFTPTSSIGRRRSGIQSAVHKKNTWAVHPCDETDQ